MKPGIRSQRSAWRAPRNSGEAWGVVGEESLLAGVAQNEVWRERLGDVVDSQPNSAMATLLASESWEKFRSSAQATLLQQAVEYTRGYRDVGGAVEQGGPDGKRPRLFLSGHQPTFFHAGVWFKNFLLDSLARQEGAVGINLIIDNDLTGSPAVLVPDRDDDFYFFRSVRYDSVGVNLPFEQRRLVDSDAFLSFPNRLQTAMRNSTQLPLASHLWREAEAMLGHFQNLGQLVAGLRHRLEAAYGLQSYEIPLSQVCSGVAFHRFVAAICLNIERFQAVYNRVLETYRQDNGIRSDSHPVPDLEEAQGGWELPFWVWTSEDPMRRRLYVHTRAATLRFFDSTGTLFELPRDELASSLADLSRQGISIRPRALTTTMFSRLVLADFFLHGIGGAKYDELTDGILQRFWGVVPPLYGTATATFRLPAAEEHDWDQEDLRQINRQLRSMKYHPEDFLESRREAQDLIRQKQTLLDGELVRLDPKEFNRRLDRVNRELSGFLEQERQDLRCRQLQVSRWLKRFRVVGSREFSFVCFSETLPEQLKRLADNVVAGHAEADQMS